MTDRTILQPGPDHPITVTPNPHRVMVRFGGRTVADTTAALTLQEADYPAVQYIPLADVDRALLSPTAHDTYCPFKGDAGYYSLAGGPDGENAVWFYAEPFEAVAPIKDHVAFYADRVSITED